MSRYNSEGYLDLTAYEAFAAIARDERRYLPLVYIASPFAGDTKRNIINAREYCRFAVSKGCIPLAPHLHYPQFLNDDDKRQRDLGLRFAMILLKKCDALWVFGDRISGGMRREIAMAQRCHIPIRRFTHNCEEVTDYDD